VTRVRPPAYACVVFDCDSTLVTIEGIDVLAGPHRDEVEQLTDLAMQGLLPLQEVYAKRLDLIAPTRDRVEAIGRAYVESLVEDAREVVAALHAAGVEVRIVSGGLLPPVLAVARELGIAGDRVAAVPVHFAQDGSYAGFQRDHPLARSGGKLELLRGWSVPRPALLVGDGITDLEARPAVDAFVAFMGVAHRAAVAAEADHVIVEPRLQGVLRLVLGG
jgi:phosphoserine phosphatase